MGFLAPWFLGGLAALGIPVFVHLLRKHVTTPRPVSSLMFFERGIQSSTRHKRLRYLLLFALRSALVLLVALAFSDPFVRRPATDVNGHLLLIVLDNSFSMRAGTRFADAKQQALTVLAAKPGPQKAQVVALGGQFEILTQPITDKAQLRAALESIQAGDGHANFGELGRSIRAMAETIKTPIDLHLFSDMQRTAMPANFADMVFPPNTKLLLHSIAKGTALPNWTIERVTAPTELSDPKDPKTSRVQAVIAGFGTPRTEKTVSLVVGGKTIATRKVTVPADGHATAEFAPVDVGYGFNRCEVRIEGSDGFPADDASIFVIRRSDPERVLFVHASNDSRSAQYFGAALAATGQASFALQSVIPEQTTDLDPSKYAFVVLSDAAALPSIFEHTLTQYIARGGSVLITLGTNVGRRARIPLWGADVKDVREYALTAGAATISQVDFTHPAVEQEQPTRDNGGWAEAKFFYAATVDPIIHSRVIARLNDDTPLLIDKQVGEGHILLFTSGFDNLTNDLPLHPIFVVFVDKTARYLSHQERLTGSQLVDSFVELRSGAEPVGAIATVEVIDPTGHRPLSLSEARTVQTFQLRRTGFYQVRFANGRDAVIGVNPDRRESDLQAMPVDIQQLWSGNAGEPVQTTTLAADDVKYRRVSLSWYVMLFALAVAVTESVIASGYMGTQREEA
jgi:hypothetical protein